MTKTLQWLLGANLVFLGSITQAETVDEVEDSFTVSLLSQYANDHRTTPINQLTTTTKYIGLRYGVGLEWHQRAGLMWGGKLNFNFRRVKDEQGGEKTWQNSYNLRLAGEAGYPLLDEDYCQIIPHIIGGYNFGFGSRRDSFGYFQGGLRINFDITENFVITPYAAFGQMVGARFTMGNNERYSLNGKGIYDFGLAMHYLVDQKLFLTFKTFYSGYKAKKAYTIAGTEHTVEASSRIIGIELGFRYSLL